jgi:hypothetical protein
MNPNGYRTISNIPSHQRFEIHNFIDKEDDLYTYSTGPNYDRKIHIISGRFWDKIFPVSLPHLLIKRHIMPLLVEKRPKIVALKSVEKKYECCECGKNLNRSDVLVSVYHSGIWCESCVEEDENLSCSKWESLD